jgi:plasmid stabilization system protein ParE
MVYDVVFSERAPSELTDILKYIEGEWSLKASNEFAEKLNEKISFIKENPYIYQAFKNKEYQKMCCNSPGFIIL